MHSKGFDCDHEDDAQETLLSLRLTLGPSPRIEEALALHDILLRNRRVDRLRRDGRRCKLVLVLGDAIEGVVQGELVERVDADTLLDRPLRKALGKRGVELLRALCSGVHDDQSLAELFGTKSNAIGVRRRRLTRILGEQLAKKSSA